MSRSINYRPGALGAGNDLEAGSYTLDEARAHALGLSGCAGFCFINPASGAEAPQGKLHVYFKSSIDGNDDPAWSSYIVQLPAAGAVRPAEGAPPSPTLLLLKSHGYTPVEQAILGVIQNALQNPVTGPLAESAEQCVEDTKSSSNTIILQTIAAADWEQGYRLSVLHNLARRVGLAGEITFAAVAGWENRDSTTVDESGRIQTKSACWREIEMIEEVLALCGAEQKEKRADFGPSWRWTWHMGRGGGATTTAVYLKVYKDVKSVDEMWIDFRPQKAFGAAPNLRSVASVSSPLGCATEFNERLKEALSKASALAQTLGWVENYEAKARELGGVYLYDKARGASDAFHGKPDPSRLWMDLAAGVAPPGVVPIRE